MFLGIYLHIILHKLFERHPKKLSHPQNQIARRLAGAFFNAQNLGMTRLQLFRQFAVRLCCWHSLYCRLSFQHGIRCN